MRYEVELTELDDHILSDQMRLARQRWVHGFKSHAGSDIMIVVEPSVEFSLEERDLIRSVFLPAEALLADGPIEAFNESLLVLLVEAGHAMR